MKTTLSAQQVIEDLVKATYGDNVSARQKHLFQEALQSLVRLAQAEQMLQIRRDVDRSMQRSSGNTSLEHWNLP